MPLLAQDLALEEGKIGPEIDLLVGGRYNPYPLQIQLLGAPELGDGTFGLDNSTNVDRLAVHGDVELS